PDGRFPGILYLRGDAGNGFVPGPPDAAADLVYLCSPNNPTGAVASRAALEAWVAWARAREAVIVFDAAYDAYVRDPALPRWIYEIPGARECAVEMRSYSKRAGFTGVRCAYTVVPKAIRGATRSGERVPLHGLWARRQSTKYNATPYVAQRAAAAIYTPEGRKQTEEQVAFYLENARLVREACSPRASRASAGGPRPPAGCGAPAGP